MAKSPEEMAQSMIANLLEKTGKTLEAWIQVVAESGEEKHGKIVSYLKSKFGVTHGYANLIAHKARETGVSVTVADPVETQYQGPKAHLRPIYDRLIAMVEALGDEVTVSPKKTYVSLRRGKQFALVQPSTRTRVDLGLQLKGVEPTGRLEASGSFNAMVSHRIRLTGVAEVDEEVQDWLRQAYERG